MALHVGLRRPKTMGGIVAFSGAYSADEVATAEVTAKPQILLVHGDADPVAPLDAMTKTKEALKALDVPVKSMTRKGAGHLIDDDGVMACETFLAKALIKPKVKKETHDHDHDEHDDHDHDHAH
jgi:phospholipase/carboxylesterase